MTIIFLLEEKSMKELLDIILPKLLPADVAFKTIAHSGKSDLQRSIPHKLKAWRQPDTKFVIVQDQDSADCLKLKQLLQDMASPFGREVLIRIACPDKIENPKRELQKLFPNHQQLDGARRIAVHMDLENNSSASFQCFVSGVKRLCQT